MTPLVSVQSIPCPDPQCVDGAILVHNAYRPDAPKEQPCDICGGKGFLVQECAPNN